MRCSRSSSSASSPAVAPASSPAVSSSASRWPAALVNLPAALLLDEPLAALDLKLREAMQIELKRIQREVGITFIFVTHDQGEALTMSDRIAVMSRGASSRSARPTDIYEAPASIFVAGFIGSANLLPGTLDGAAAGTPVAVLDSGERLALPAAGDARDGDPVTVMLRPERITIDAGAPGDGRSLRAVVRDVIFQGSSMRLIADAAGHTELLVTIENDDDVPTPRLGDDDHAAVGARTPPYALRGRSEIVGATTTDVDEVQATMDGRDVVGGRGGQRRRHRRAGCDRREGGSRINRRALLIGGGVVAIGAIGAVLLSGAGGGSGSEAADRERRSDGGRRRRPGRVGESAS